MTLITNMNKILKGFDKCVICRSILDVSFPKDFPDEWKFCCSCLEWAKMVVKINPETEYLREISVIRRVEKRITLVG